MLSHLTQLAALKIDRRGVTALEYGLIAALIAGAIVAIVSTIGGGLNSSLTTLSGHLPS